MSKMYEKVKKYYDTGLWSEERIRNMVIKDIITDFDILMEISHYS